MDGLTELPEEGPSLGRGLPPIGWVGLGIVVIFLLVALLGEWVTPYRPSQLVGDPLMPPRGGHLLGTNGLGQDLTAQMVSGVRVSLVVAFLAGAGTLILGTVLGLLAGWIGGHVDAAIMRVVDLVLATPRLPLLIVVGTYVGPTLPVVSLIIALTFWPMSARVVRSQVLSLRYRAHVRSSLGFGAGTGYVMRRHIVPEVGLILVAGLVASAGRAVTLEAGLAFLGLGDPVRASWGKIMRDASNFSGLFHTDAWVWWLLPPIVAISLLLMGITFLGIAAESRISPRVARHPGDRP